MNHICLLKACHLVVKNKASRFVCFFFSYCIGALPFISNPCFLSSCTHVSSSSEWKGFQHFNSAREERLQSLKTHPQRAKHPGPLYSNLVCRNEPVCHEATEGLSLIPFRLLTKTNPGGIRLSNKKATLSTQIFKPDKK